MSVWGVIGVVLVILLAIAGIGAGTGMFNIGNGEIKLLPGDLPDMIGDCNIVPTLSISAKDSQAQATSLSPGALYNVNGVYFATAPTFARGDKVQVISNLSGYIDVLSPIQTLDCGANTLSVLMNDYTAPTVKILEDSITLTDSVTGSSNGSAVVSGGSETFTVQFVGHDKDSTGDIIYVIELASTAKVSSVTMYADAQLEEVDVPEFYANTLSSPKVIAFKVPAIVGAVEKEYKMTFVAKSGQTIEGAVYTTAYVGEPLVEDDGSFTAWAVEDSTGTANYEATFDYDIALI